LAAPLSTSLREQKPAKTRVYSSFFRLCDRIFVGFLPKIGSRFFKVSKGAIFLEKCAFFETRKYVERGAAKADPTDAPIANNGAISSGPSAMAHEVFKACRSPLAHRGVNRAFIREEQAAIRITRYQRASSLKLPSV
jgi:hypothetical protein